MKIKTLVAGSLVAAAIAIGVTTVVLINIKAPGQSAQTTPETPAKNENEITFTAVAGKNVLEQLKTRAQVETKDSQYGPFVDAINGKKEEGKYWSYYVNDQMAAVGAAELITQGGEKVTWKLE